MRPAGHQETQEAFVLRALQEPPYKLTLEAIQKNLVLR